MRNKRSHRRADTEYNASVTEQRRGKSRKRVCYIHRCSTREHREINSAAPPAAQCGHGNGAYHTGTRARATSTDTALYNRCTMTNRPFLTDPIALWSPPSPTTAAPARRACCVAGAIHPTTRTTTSGRSGVGARCRAEALHLLVRTSGFVPRFVELHWLLTLSISSIQRRLFHGRRGRTNTTWRVAGKEIRNE